MLQDPGKFFLFNNGSELIVKAAFNVVPGSQLACICMLQVLENETTSGVELRLNVFSFSTFFQVSWHWKFLT